MGGACLVEEQIGCVSAYNRPRLNAFAVDFQAGRPIVRDGFAYILAKHVAVSAARTPSIKEKLLSLQSCDTLRHAGRRARRDAVPARMLRGDA